jgi:nitroimidazol reductase NimA-like FMN-containing flavoprotein (pyridoxamine 5'-phosphate oxidase superfamily)
MNHDEGRALLETAHLGRLGCISDGSPYVVPVSFLLSGERLYVHSLPGRKIDAMRANPKVCLQVDDIRDDYNWRSAIAFGRFEEVTDAGERSWAVRRLLSRFPHLTPVESVPVHDGQSSVVVFSIRIEQITGACEE